MIGRRLPRSFYRRPVTEVAPDLIGRVLVRDLPDGTRLAVRLVETEAYRQDDAASHSFGGPTPRNATMFGPAGHLYVYFTYGMHHCMNAVTGSPEGASAVLLRAGEPLLGIEEMGRRRGGRPVRELCRGPANLCQALGVDRRLDGADLARDGDIWIGAGSRPAGRVLATPRIGIRRDVDRRWRFVEGSSGFASGRASAGTRATASASGFRSSRR